MLVLGWVTAWCFQSCPSLAIGVTSGGVQWGSQVITFLLFQQTAVQSTVLFLFLIFDNILQFSCQEIGCCDCNNSGRQINVIMIDSDDHR